MYKQLSDVLEDNFKYIKHEELKNFLIETTSGRIPETFPKINFNSDDSDCIFEYFSDMTFFREVYNHFCSWPIITNNWVSILANLLRGKKCIEIMAGNGLLSHAFQTHHIDITPYDNYSWTINNNYTTVYEMDAIDCADKLNYDYIICSWPPYSETDICEVVKMMYYKHPKSKMIYIGEDMCGCTACDDFFDITDGITKGKESKIISLAAQSFSRFYGIHDSIYLLKPNSKVKSKIFNRGEVVKYV